MKTTNHAYVRKGNVGYDFYRGYKYGKIGGNIQAIGNTFVATETKLYGFTWNEKTINFDSAEEGNDFFKTLIEDGYKVCNKSEYDDLRPWD